MSLALILFIVRLVPYVIALVNAYRKGYRWLTLLTAYLIGLTVFNYSTSALDATHQLLGTVFAYLLMLHSLNINPRR